MHYNYEGVLAAASEMEGYSGYLDGDELKASQQAQNTFAGVRNRFVYDVLSTGDDPEEIKGRIVGDLDQLADEHPGWAGTAGVVRDELLLRIDEESRKNPTWRKMVRYTPMAIGVLLVVGYFGTKFYNDVDLSHSFDTKEGIVARAAALEKTLRYDDLASTRTRRGGLVKSVVLWPLSPSDAEVNAAMEVAGFAYDAEAFLREQQVPCNFPYHSNGEELSESEKAFLEGYADRLQASELTWDEDPKYTMLVTVSKQLSCPDIDFGSVEAPAVENE